MRYSVEDITRCTVAIHLFCPSLQQRAPTLTVVAYRPNDSFISVQVRVCTVGSTLINFQIVAVWICTIHESRATRIGGNRTHRNLPPDVFTHRFCHPTVCVFTYSTTQQRPFFVCKDCAVSHFPMR